MTAAGGRTSAASGLVVVDKPTGRTSHDVVARLRRLAGTRRVGHAGTLDPMATGVLLVGIERATRLLGHLALTDKTYTATIRLGQATVTDDAEGEVIGRRAAAVDVTDEAVAAGVAALTGDIEQVPSSVSAIKVDGQRSYARVRAGEDVELAARPVTVSRFEVLACDGRATWSTSMRSSSARPAPTSARWRATWGSRSASAGTSPRCAVRASARSASSRRARSSSSRTSGRHSRSRSSSSATFPRRDVDESEAGTVTHGGRLVLDGETGPTGVFSPDGRALALMEPRDGSLRPLVVLAPA